VVMKVGDARITKADVDALIAGMDPRTRQMMGVQGRKSLGEQYATLLVLSRQAMSEHLDSTPSVRQTLELQKEQILARAEYEKLNKEVQVTPDEATQYFNSHQPDFEKAQMREFFVRVRPASSNDPKTGLTAAEAKAKAEAIRQAVVSGTDIKKVSDQFAIPNVITIDTTARPVRHHDMLPALDAAAFSLKDNEVSQPIELPNAVVMIQVTGHVRPEQKEVAPEIENKLKQQKFEAKMDGLKKQMGVWMDDKYFTGPSPRAAGPPAPPGPAPASQPTAQTAKK